MAKRDEVENPRSYGSAPYRIVVVHGGPGAPGEVAPLARELSRLAGTLEPFQVAPSLEGQVRELGTLLADRTALPAVLVGHSWGAMLSYLTAGTYPDRVARLVLVSSGPLEAVWVPAIEQTRRARMDAPSAQAYQRALETLGTAQGPERERAFAKLGQILARVDAYDPMPHEEDVLETEADLFASVWGEFERLRREGAVLARGAAISCPIVVLHGENDPHPADGVVLPLRSLGKSPEVHLLARCGHYPWYERQARALFWARLQESVEPALGPPAQP